MNAIVINRLKRQVIRDLASAMADLPEGHQFIFSQSENLITLADFARFAPGTNNHEIMKILIKKPNAEFDPIQFANDAEIMLSMIKSKMKVAA